MVHRKEREKIGKKRELNTGASPFGCPNTTDVFTGEKPEASGAPIEIAPAMLPMDTCQRLRSPSYT